MAVAPWNREDLFPAPPADWDYGWWEDGKPRRGDPEALAERCKGDKPLLVWTPDSGGTVVDREVDFLRPAVFERERAAARRNLTMAKVSFAIWSGLLAIQMWDFQSSRWSGPLFMWVVLGLVPLAGAWRTCRGLRREPGPILPEEKEAARFASWLAQKSWKETLGTHGVVIVIALISFAMLATGMAPMIKVAGLDKAAFWSGEWWRLWTGPWLHAGVLHWFFNTAVLYALGRQVEAVFGRGWLLLILLVAMLAGSLASVCWLDNTSVGFSGAILGLLGFQVGVLSRRPGLLPAGVLKSSLMSLALLAALGVVGLQIIDNAAHFGGVAAGALLGWQGAAQCRDEMWRPGRALAVTAGLLLGGSAVWTMWVLVDHFLVS